MWHCDELLTKVVITLVNRFVQGHVPTPVSWFSMARVKYLLLVR